MTNSVPADRLRSAPARRIRLAERHALELDARDPPFSSVTTRVGAAWKMARAPSSIVSWTSFAAGMSFMSRR